MRLAVALIAMLVVVSVLAPSARADHAYIEISIPIDTVVRAQEGTTTQLATADVPAEFVDHSCEVSAHAENQESVHEGNDLLVESGTSSVILADVESESGRVTEAQQDLLLAELITVSLVMGPDKVFSAGIDVVVECIPEETTTTAEVSDTEVTTTTQATSTTTEEETTTTGVVSDTEVTTTQPSTTSSIEDEVLGTEVLPFTGGNGGQLALLATGLLAMGTLLVVSATSTED